MSHPYDVGHAVPFPVLPVVLRQIDGSAKTTPVAALVDSGADVTIAPKAFLTTVGAEEIFSGYLRAHWGGRRAVTVFLVDLEIEGRILPGVEVAGDEPHHLTAGAPGATLASTTEPVCSGSRGAPG